MHLTQELVPSEASEYAITLIGWIISLQMSKRVISERGVVIDWVKMIIRCSEEEQGVLIRTGAVESLRVSKALHFCQKLLDNPYEKETPFLTDICLQCWLIALRLMQDDDEDIRDFAMRLVVEFLSSG